MKREFISRKICVVSSENRSLIGVCGLVVDETKETLVIENKDEQGSRKVLLKSQVVFETTYKGKKIRIDGKKIARKHEDRIKQR